MIKTVKTAFGTAEASVLFIFYAAFQIFGASINNASVLIRANRVSHLFPTILRDTVH